jgi:hypothetical protein
MVLGGVWCPKAGARRIHDDIRGIKMRHGLKPETEIKWTKVSPNKISLYLDLLNYFFDVDNLHFRCLFVPDKSLLDHAAHYQTHDEWYYKMYFNMLKVIIDPNCTYHIYLDIKDTRGAEKARTLQGVLANAHYDFREIIQRIQLVSSREVGLVQLADVLIGAIAYANRGLSESAAKQKLVELLRTRSGYSLTRNTLLRENKVNIFRWHAQEAQ